MDEILKCIDKLTKILVDSDVYQNYLLSRENLSSNDLKLLTEYKKVQTKLILSGSNDFGQKKIISHLYSNLMLNTQTRLFLENELKLTNCMKKIYTRIADGIEMDVFA